MKKNAKMDVEKLTTFEDRLLDTLQDLRKCRAASLDVIKLSPGTASELRRVLAAGRTARLRGEDYHLVEQVADSMGH